MAWLFVIVGSVAYTFWRTNQYLKPKVGIRRTQLSMIVRNGRIHYRHTP